MAGARRVGLMMAVAMAAMTVLAGAQAGAEAPAALPAGSDKVDEAMLRYNLHPAFVKLGRGVSNGLLGWLELPLQTQKHYQPSDAATSILTGAAVGVVKGVVRTGVGLYETVTFFLPYPEQFAQILPTLDYFRKDQRRTTPLLLE